ncbi:MAG: dephospho-CoA kinase [Lachnospiraceae bacterium]|nr:dephospho-CoA kinase [Lachnospiraceae bacterium]
MITIGVTGGVGAGKSAILSYIKEHYRAVVYPSDEVAKSLERKGEACYAPIVSVLGEDILDENGEIIKAKMAQKIFSSPDLLEKVNGILHPAVKDFFLAEIERLRKEDSVDLFIIEAALLIEEQYDKILDELWYIYASVKTRSDRLRESRGYSDEKIQSIMKSQLPEETFRKACKVTIENEGDLIKTYAQIDNALQNRGVRYATGK